MEIVIICLCPLMCLLLLFLVKKKSIQLFIPAQLITLALTLIIGNVAIMLRIRKMKN